MGQEHFAINAYCLEVLKTLYLDYRGFDNKQALYAPIFSQIRYNYSIRLYRSWWPGTSANPLLFAHT